MLFLVAAITNVKVKVANVVSTSRVDGSQTLLELLVASAVEAREEVIVLQSVFLFTWGDVIAMIVLSTTLISLCIASQVVIAISSVSRSTPVNAIVGESSIKSIRNFLPFRAGKTQIDSFLCLSIAIDWRFAHFRVVAERRFTLQRLSRFRDVHENYEKQKLEHFDLKANESLTKPQNLSLNLKQNSYHPRTSAQQWTFRLHNQQSFSIVWTENELQNLSRGWNDKIYFKRFSNQKLKETIKLVMKFVQQRTVSREIVMIYSSLVFSPSSRLRTSGCLKAGTESKAPPQAPIQ